MSELSKLEELVARFEHDYLPNLKACVISKDIARNIAHDFDLLKVFLSEPGAKSIATQVLVHDDELQAAVDFVGIRDEEPAEGPAKV